MVETVHILFLCGYHVALQVVTGVPEELVVCIFRIT
jgi:hypothetical protein